MFKFNKFLFGVMALFVLPELYAYQCQIDLERNYSGYNAYMNGKGDVYITVDYVSGRYDAMEYVYDIKNCQKISDGVKKNSNIRNVLDKNGFHQIDSGSDLSPWLTHYYHSNKQDNRLVLSVNELSSQEQQGMRELFAYSRDKGNSPSSAAGAMFNTKYAKTSQFRGIVSSYFRSHNFARYANRIEQELLRSPASLKDGVDLHFLENKSYKIVARNSQTNEFKITLQPKEQIEVSKVPVIIMRADCRDISGLKNNRYRTVDKGGIFATKEYRQEVADKTVTCSLNGQKSDASLKASLSTAANILGLKEDISFADAKLGTFNELVVLNEQFIAPPPPSPEEIARRERDRERNERDRERDERRKECHSRQSNCRAACPSSGIFTSVEEAACIRQCETIHACAD
ncbi:hypothetical protein ACWIUH_09790 [Ursidibacter arcticus]